MFHEAIKNIPFSKHLHIIIGSFDGIHVAHKKIIESTLLRAKELNEPTLIFSFEPLPKEYFQDQIFLGRLQPAHIKRKILESFGADHVLITDFRIIKNFSEKEFMEILLSCTESATIYSGDDFRMGRTDGEPYKGNNLHFIREPQITVDRDICRSTEIRSHINQGNIEKSNKLLGYEYTIYSHTTEGDRFGHTIDFPTINIIPNHQVIPKAGVYFSEATIKDTIYPSMTYVGHRPTVFGKTLRIETHIITEFPDDRITRGTPIELSFIKRISEEKVFTSIEEMKKMLYNYKEISLALATERYK